MQHSIGIDIGGTKILGVISDPSTGEVLHRLRVSTPRHDQDALGQALIDVVNQLQVHPVNGIGVGMPGLVDHAGVLHYGPNVPDVLGFDPVSVLAGHTDLPVVVDNDANHAAVAEHRFGAARGHDNAVIITQGTGIGGALILGGRLYRGSHGFAGEPGHMVVERGGHRCACGQLGCWETVSSGAGLRNLASDLTDEGRGAGLLELAGGDRFAIRGEHVAAAREAGDQDAIEIFDRFATRVAMGLGGLITLLDPSVVVLGGGLTDSQGHFIDRVSELVGRHTLGGSYRPSVPIVPAQLGPEAGAIGGAVAVSDR